jgi:hypothetical protein
MGRAAFLKIINLECTSAQSEDNSLEVSLQTDHKNIIFAEEK